MITEIESAEIAHASITAGHSRIIGGHPMLNAFAEELRAAIEVPHNGENCYIPEGSGLRTNGKRKSTLAEIREKLETIKTTQKNGDREAEKGKRIEAYANQVKDRRPSVNRHDSDEKAMEFPLNFDVDEIALERNEILFSKLIGLSVEM